MNTKSLILISIFVLLVSLRSSIISSFSTFTDAPSLKHMSTSSDMAPVKLNTWGSSTIYRPAERAILYINVASEGPSQKEVSEEVATTAATLRAQLETLCGRKSTGSGSSAGNMVDDTKRIVYAEDGSMNVEAKTPVTFWSSKSLTTGSYIPVDPNQSQSMFGASKSSKPPPQERVFTARQSFTAIFADFGVLGSFTTDLSQTPAISISRVEWDITAATRKMAGTESRTNAVLDAGLKAKDLANAMGENAIIRPIEVTEQGDIYGGGRGMARAFAAVESQQELVFEPEDVEIRCGVDSKFEVYWK